MVQLRAQVLEERVNLPAEGVRCQVANTKIFIGEQEYGSGTLCVAESNLLWRNENEQGLCLEYPNIALHAISRDLSAFPHECIYMVLDSNLLGMSGEDNEEEEDENEAITIIRFVPEDKLKLNQIFSAMNDCQALYPDSMNESDEDEEAEETDYNHIGYSGEVNAEMADGDHTYFTSETDPDNIHLSERGQEVLRRINFNFKPESQDENNNRGGSAQEQYEDAEGNE